MSLALSEKALKVKPSSTLAITAKAKKLKEKGVDVVGFGAGEPDFDTPINIKDAASDAINSGFTKYTPASGTDELKLAISKKFKEFNGLNYEKNQIVVSNGGKHSLTNIFEAIMNPGDEVIIPAPYWLTYPEIVKLCDGVPVYLYGDKKTGYKITAEQVQDAITPKTKALILNTPSNPTGMIYSEEELKAIADVVVKNDIYVVADEMYEYLIYGDKKHVSIASLGDEIYKRTITCSGVSKSYAMTGWRIGYTGSSVEIAKLMSSIQSHQTSNPCSIAQKAATEAINGCQNTVGEMKKEFDERRKFMSDRIQAMPLVDTLEPEGAFYVFVDCSELIGRSYKERKIESANCIANILIEDYNVAVVPCEDFGFDKHIRLSYAISMKAITKGLDRIEDFLNTLS
ncbi:aspartate aminotransferase [Aequitasia blattaphilus]|uniref:Aminotransferase n=1 Tax=Aequitasia blattaphilus TaxID=2949332 RepID=A0ABT1E730_9FIRM|nr:pyridoxal phosphate-dependent aminotransferase [Aequitasia blattaphilus]MCP1101624.1 pyridoxal phosphate-dependent aminotransferase [Aequitasia blattaphilus]MCR8614264.1 pyridoxal phosphate-dependent aminotransferase [Aequitasia blattaphilus]